MSKSNIFDREKWKILYQAWMVDELSPSQVAGLAGYSDEAVIYKALKGYGIPIERRSGRRNPLYATMLTDDQEQILLGSMLGDGCIRSNGEGRAPYYVETHSIRQLGYLEWKAGMLSPFIKNVSKPYVGHKGTQAYIKSGNLPQLGFYRSLFYVDDKKSVPIEALEWMKPISLAVWYMDDGSMSRSSGQISLATCAFDALTAGRLQGWLLGKFEVKFSVVFDREQPKLVLQKADNDRFLELVSPYIISPMRYKLGTM